MITVASFNFENGGRLPNGSYDFDRLQTAFADFRQSPDLIWLFEAKEWLVHGGEPGYDAAEALQDVFGVHYVIEIGEMERAPMPPALIYDPATLVLKQFFTRRDPLAYRDRLNVAKFDVRGGHVGRSTFLTVGDHWPPRRESERLSLAKDLAGWGRNQLLPIIACGDWNCTASGPHLPQRAWEDMPFPDRRFKGKKNPDGTWGPDTEAMDALVGYWDEETSTRQERGGFYLIAETAWGENPSKPILPTINDDVDPGGGILNDAIIVNERANNLYVPGSYRVHVPRPPFPSDHRVSEAGFYL